MIENVNERVIALVPVHNESEIVERTIMSLINQTYPNIDILVISDNSTDNTVELVRKIMTKYDNIDIIETENNKFKKAGALNIAYKFLGERLNEYDYTLTIDGDTVLADDVIEQALIEFSLNNKLGVVCSRSGVMKQTTKTLMEKYLYHVQHLEYGDFDRDRIGQDKAVRVAHGMCSVYKVKAIQDVINRRQTKGDGDCVYKVTSIIEDYELTITLRELGYQTTAGFGMYAWTEVPVTINALWKQRIRWYRGGIDAIRDHGFNRVTAVDIFDHTVMWTVLISQLIVLTWTILDVHNNHYNINASGFIVGIMYLNSVYSIRYVQNPQKWDYAIRLTYIPHLAYTLFTALEQFYAYYLSIFKPNKKEW